MPTARGGGEGGGGAEFEAVTPVNPLHALHERRWRGRGAGLNLRAIAVADEDMVTRFTVGR